MRSILALSLAGMLALIGACASVPESDEYVAIGDPQTLADIGLGERPVTIEFPAGELMVEGVDSGDLVARLVIRCQTARESCLERAAEVSLGRHDDGAGIRLAVENAPLLKLAGAQLNLSVEMPAASDLLIDMGYGDLTVTGIAGCLVIDMNAGDVEVVGPLTSVASVWLDAGTGDATLHTPMKTIEGKRSWLVGAEVDWRQGPGPCRMDVDLNAGAIEVTLE